MEQYLRQKGRFYRDFGCGVFSSPKRRIQDLFPKLANSNPIYFDKTKITKDDILYAKEIESAYTYSVLDISHKGCFIKIPKNNVDLGRMKQQLHCINAYNKSLPRNPVLFPKTVFEKSDDQKSGIFIQEYIKGPVLSLRYLENNTNLQSQFQALLQGTFTDLQQYHKREITFPVFMSALKSVFLGKKRSLDELLKNFVIDEYWRIRVVSLYALEMNVEALQISINCRTQHVISKMPPEGRKNAGTELA